MNRRTVTLLLAAACVMLAVLIYAIGYAIVQAPPAYTGLTVDDARTLWQGHHPADQAVVTYEPDNGGMWVIFGIGVGLGAALMGCALIPIYRRGFRKGRKGPYRTYTEQLRLFNEWQKRKPYLEPGYSSHTLRGPAIDLSEDTFK